MSLLSLPYELRSHAARNFAHLPHRYDREHQAETDLVQRFFDGTECGYFVEVGANDPRQFSQTWHLEQRGWSGVLVEPIPDLCARLRAERPRSQVVQAACGTPEQRGIAEFYVAGAPQHDPYWAGQNGQDQGKFTRFDVGPSTQMSTLRLDLLETPVERVEKVRMTTLDEVLAQTQLPRLDFLSIDVEGAQLEVLRGVTLSRHRPRLILIEDTLTDLRTHRHLVRQGYRLVKRTGINNWYIPQDHPFALTSPRERFALWRKLWLRTPYRKLRFALRRR